MVLDMLSSADIATFMRDGFVPVRGAVPRPVVDACVDVIWKELEAQGIARDNAGSWSSPVVRIDSPDEGDRGRPLAEAGTARLLWVKWKRIAGQMLLVFTPT